MSAEEFRDSLQQFTGTSTWYQDSALPELRFTDGVKFFIEQTQAVQVLLWAHRFALPLLPSHRFLSLVFEQGDKGCTLKIQDGNYQLLHSEFFTLKKLPTGDWEFWFQEGVLYLPSEH